MTPPPDESDAHRIPDCAWPAGTFKDDPDCPLTRESDALTVAKWCWPEHDWLRLCEQFGEDFPFRWGGVSSAERVLIDRGLRRKYGEQLRWALLPALGVIHLSGPASDDGVPTVEEALAIAATASLDARVRAMAAVVRAQTEART